MRRTSGMVAASPPPGDFRRRAIGMYALALMARDGALHGYGLSERIAERTEGAWRPGAGAVYPSLRKLEELGLARSRVGGRRRMYAITPAGRALLSSLRARHRAARSAPPDLSELWSEILGSSGAEEFLIQRLRRAFAAIDTHRRPTDRAFSRRVVAEVDRWRARWRSTAPGPHRRSRT